MPSNSERGNVVISVVCWLWNSPGYRSKFGPDAVNVLASMVRRHYQAPHRIICVTSEPAGIDPKVDIVPDRADFANVKSPRGDPLRFPSCYRRLRLFAPDAVETFGDRIVSLDLDCVITGDLRQLWDRDEDFVGLQDSYWQHQLNGSMFLLRAGSQPDVWTTFSPETSPQVAMNAGFKGSDQAWLSYCLRDAARWTRADGVYSYQTDLRVGLPDDARAAMFWGKVKPWDTEAQRLAWVREHWR